MVVGVKERCDGSSAEDVSGSRETEKGRIKEECS